MKIPAARAALIGLASGSRSTAGVAALALTAPANTAQQPDRTLARGWVKGLLTVAVLGELVGDKLPVTPSRLAPIQLGGRIAAGAAVGLILARRPSEGAVTHSPARLVTEPVRVRDTAVAVVIGASAAAGGAYAGAAWRTIAVRRFGRDWVGAAIEDVVAVSLALGGARR